MRMFRLCAVITALALLAVSWTAQAGQVWTLDGKTYEGDTRFDAGALILTPKGGQPLKLKLDDILYASLSLPHLGEPGVAGAAVAGSGPLKQRNIGRVPKPGTCEFAQGIFSLKSTAGAIWGISDNFDFFQQDFHGDGQLVARILDVSKTSPNGRVGLMMRAGPEANARFGMISVSGAGEIEFRFRNRMGMEVQATAGGPAVKLPIWLKLMRHNQQFIGLKSLDGRQWVLVGQTFQGTVPRDNAGELKPNTLAGLALGPGVEGTTVTASVGDFTATEFTRPAPAGDPAEKPKPAELVSVPLELSGRGVLTRNGTFMSGATFASADKTTVQFTRPGGMPLATEYSQLARINLQPLTPGMLAQIPKGLSGVLLTNGDFMEGEIGGIVNGKVTVSSVVFGLSTYQLADDIRAVVFRAPKAVESAYRVQLVDGSVLVARSIKSSAKDELTVDDQSIGSVTLGMRDLCVIRAGELRSVQLTDIKPDNVDAPAGKDPTSNSVFDPLRGSWMNVAGVFSERGTVVATGSTLTYDVDGGYRVFVCRVGVPDSAPVKGTVRFVITADGKELRNVVKANKEAPTVISVSVAGVKELKLSVEGGGDADVPSFGLWGDPVLGK